MKPNARILLDTLEHTLESEQQFGERFYARLFARHPELESLFKQNSRGAQSKMFAQKLTAIVDNLDDPEWLRRELGAIARSHAGYGVTPEMYVPVGEALIATVREACAESWSPEAEAAWRTAYAALTQAILDTAV
jgi:hemoglobin-like flavoprotein